MTDKFDRERRTHLLTTCTAEKSLLPGLLPAVERYRGARVTDALAQSQVAGVPLLFLSGRFGVIASDYPMLWYDQVLEEGAVEALVPRVAGQLRALGVRRLLALLQPADTPGWAPYHRLLAEGCVRARVSLEVSLTVLA
jgi:hypothetical protein